MREPNRRPVPRARLTRLAGQRETGGPGLAAGDDMAFARGRDGTFHVVLQSTPVSLGDAVGFGAAAPSSDVGG